MRKLLGILLVAGLAAGPARALELSMGGSFYACVLEGDCQQPVDLWGIGPSRSPLFLGHFEGRVQKRQPIYLGAYKSGQEMYLWHEVTDTSSGQKKAGGDIKDRNVYRVGVDPRGGYLIEVRAPTQDDALLKVWIYPARAPASATQGSSIDPAPRAVGAVGSVVVNGKPPGVQVAAPLVNTPPGSASKQADGWGGWHWPLLQFAIAGLLIVSYRRSRQMTLAVAGGADLDMVPAPRADAAHQFRAMPEHRIASSPPPPAIVHADAPTEPAYRRAPEAAPQIERDVAHEVVEALAHEDEAHEAPARSAVHASTVAPPPTEHFHARAPEGWSPIATEGPAAAATRTAPLAPPIPDHSATPYHQPAHPRPAALPPQVPAPVKPANVAAPESVEDTVVAAPPAHTIEEHAHAAAAHAHAATAHAQAATTHAQAAESHAHGAASHAQAVAPHMHAEVHAHAAPHGQPEAHAHAAQHVQPDAHAHAAQHAHAEAHAHSTEAHTAAPAKTASKAAAGSAATAPAPQAEERLLEALGRRRPHGLPISTITQGATHTATPAAAPSAGVLSVMRALSSTFHDIETVHADDECVIFSAYDLQMQRRVSIHALSPALARDERLAAQFVREGHEFSTLSHRALLRIHRVASEPIPHLVGDALPGHPLSRALAGAQAMPVHEVLAVGLNLAEALDYLHQRGMVHGDVRPSRMTAGFHCEFRLFPPIFPRMSTEQITSEERRGHRAPEAATSSTADYRGDIYGLGLVMHEMLTGGPPPRVAEGDEDEDHFVKLAGLPEALGVLVRRCLQADPGRRYQDCGIARQTLDALFREHAARERVVLSCLTGVARVVRASVHKLHPLLEQAEKLGPVQLATEVAGPAWREAVHGGLLAESGLPAIAALLERADALKKWPQEASLVKLLERLGRLAIHLAGLATLVDSGGPRHPSVAYRARVELLDLAQEVAEFEKAVQAEVSSRLVDLHSVVAGAVEAVDGVQVDHAGVPASLRALFADPHVVRRQLVGALAGVLAAARSSGARKIAMHGTYEEGFRRVTLILTDDGRNVMAPIVRPPLPIVPRLTRPPKGYVDAQPRDLDSSCEPIERLGGRVMVSNRTDEQGVETRISLPSHLC